MGYFTYIVWIPQREAQFWHNGIKETQQNFALYMVTKIISEASSDILPAAAILFSFESLLQKNLKSLQKLGFFFLHFFSYPPLSDRKKVN